MTDRETSEARTTERETSEARTTDRETNETRTNISLILMKLLHQIGISKKMRRRRRYCCLQDEELWTFLHGEKTSIFGSQIEGSTTQGLRSDIDYVLYLKNIIAVRDIQDAVPGIGNFLMVTDDNTYPGYYKLQLLHPSSLEPLYAGNAGELKHDHTTYSIDCNQRLVFNSSSLLHQSVDPIHGPAISRTCERTWSQDYVMAMRVNSWSQIAVSWLMRHRRNNWITANESDYFLTKETFLVPVGNPLSLERHFEWRLSFTGIERELMWRLNNTQVACYILIKIINKSFITTTVGECLSSYHCKTALFHLIDSTDKEFWKPNNLLNCLNLMLKTLSSWVEYGFCPNYFITNENMFLGKVQGKLRRRLHSLLVYLIDQDFKYLTQIGCDGLGQAFSEACSKHRIQPDKLHVISDAGQSRKGKDLHALTFMEVTLFRICSHYKFQLQSSNTPILYTLIQRYQISNSVLQDALSVLIALLCSHFGSQLASSCIAANRMFCRCMELAHMFLRIGARSDVTSGRLKLAGFYLRIGYASHAEEVLTAVEQDLKPFVSDISPLSLYHLQDETCQKLLSEEMKTDQIFKSSIALSVIYLPSEMHCTPPPLCYEMFWSVSADPGLRDHKIWLEVDARPFLYFLQHQTYSALGMDRQRVMAFQNLVVAIGQERITHQETNLNLVAYCLRQEGQTCFALESLQQSLQIKPKKNSAIWQICDIMNEIWNIQK